MNVFYQVFDVFNVFDFFSEDFTSMNQTHANVKWIGRATMRDRQVLHVIMPYTRWAKKAGRLMAIILSNLNRLEKFSLEDFLVSL